MTRPATAPSAAGSPPLPVPTSRCANGHGIRAQDRAAAVRLEARQLGEARREGRRPHDRPVDERAERRANVEEAEAVVLAAIGIAEGPAGDLEASVDGEEDGAAGNGRGQRSLGGEAAGELGQVLVGGSRDLVEVGGRQGIAGLDRHGADGDAARRRALLEDAQVAGVRLGHGEGRVDVGEEQDAAGHPQPPRVAARARKAG